MKPVALVLRCNTIRVKLWRQGTRDSGLWTQGVWTKRQTRPISVGYVHVCNHHTKYLQINHIFFSKTSSLAVHCMVSLLMCAHYDPWSADSILLKVSLYLLTNKIVVIKCQEWFPIILVTLRPIGGSSISFPHYFGAVAQLLGTEWKLIRNAIQLTYLDLVYMGLKCDLSHMGTLVRAYCKVHR